MALVYGPWLHALDLSLATKSFLALIEAQSKFFFRYYKIYFKTIPNMLSKSGKLGIDSLVT